MSLRSHSYAFGAAAVALAAAVLGVIASPLSWAALGLPVAWSIALAAGVRTVDVGGRLLPPVVIVAGALWLAYGHSTGESGYLALGLVASTLLLVRSVDHMAIACAAVGAAAYLGSWAPEATYLLIPVVVATILWSSTRIRTACVGAVMVAASALASLGSAGAVSNVGDGRSLLIELGESAWFGSGADVGMPTVGLSVVGAVGVVGAGIVIAAVFASVRLTLPPAGRRGRALRVATPLAVVIGYLVADSWSPPLLAAIVLGGWAVGRAAGERVQVEVAGGLHARVELLGLEIDALGYRDAIDRVLTLIARPGTAQVGVANVHGLTLRRGDAALSKAYSDAELVLPDGMPLVWSARRAGATWTERVDGTSLVDGVAEQGVERGVAHYFVGGEEGVARKVADRLAARYPGFRCVGTESPPFREPTPQEDAALFERIRASGADVVWVALGAPRQEIWARRAREQLDDVVLIGVGAAFGFLSGDVPRAPVAMQAMGLEWLFRLAMEPRRLWRRCFVEYPPMLPALLWKRPRLITLPSTAPGNTTHEAPEAAEPLPAPPPRASTWWATPAIALLSGAVSAGFASSRGLSPTDALWIGLCGALVSLAGAVAAPASVAWFAVATLAVAGHPVLALVGVATAVVNRRRNLGDLTKMTIVAVTFPWWIVDSGAPTARVVGLVVAMLPILVDATRSAAMSAPARRIGRAAAIAAFLVVVVASGTLLSVGGSVAASAAALDEARAGQQRVDALGRAVDELKAAQNALGGLGPQLLSVLPGGGHVEWMETVTESLTSVGEAAVTLTDDLQASGPVDERGHIDFESTERIRAKLADLRQKTAAVRTQIGDALETPTPGYLRSIAGDVDDILIELEDPLERMDALLEAVPALGGEDVAQRYLFLIGTPSEARELGGFVGAYAIVEVRGGEIVATEVGTNEDANSLIEASSPIPVDVAEVGERYAHYKPHVFFQNVTGSPDFPTVARTAKRLFDEAGEPVDGVVYVDPEAIGTLLAPYGPIVVDELGVEIEAEDLANWIYLDQYWEYPDEEIRNEVVEGVLGSVLGGMERFADGDPLAMIDSLASLSVGRNLLLFHSDPEIQDLIDEAGLAGEYAGDGTPRLGVFTSNAGANKLDAFLEQDIEYRIEHAGAGAATAATSITLANTVDEERSLPSVVEHDRDGFPGRNTAMVSVYSWQPIDEVLVDSEPVEFESYAENGMFRAVVFTTIEPGEQRLVEAVTQPFALGDEAFSLTIDAQPRVAPARISVGIDAVLGRRDISVDGDLFRPRSIETDESIELDRGLTFTFE